jgi:hypothetical protein
MFCVHAKNEYTHIAARCTLPPRGGSIIRPPSPRFHSQLRPFSFLSSLLEGKISDLMQNHEIQFTFAKRAVSYYCTYSLHRMMEYCTASSTAACTVRNYMPRDFFCRNNFRAVCHQVAVNQCLKAVTMRDFSHTG